MGIYQNIIIRKALISDLEDYISIKSEQSALDMAGWVEAASDEVYKNHYQKILEDNNSRCYVGCINGMVVGWIRRYIEKGSNVVRIEYNVKESCRGKSIGKELIRYIVNGKKKNEIIKAYVREDNAASEQVFLKCGFVKTQDYKLSYIQNMERNVRMYKYVYK